jgi:hypothetical protein
MPKNAFEGMKKAGRTKVDFSDAGDRGPFNPVHQEEGDYLFKIVAVLDSPTKESKEPQWIFAFQDSERASAIYPYRCKLDKQNAWKIRNVFEAVGIKVAQKMLNVDPQKVVGKMIGATLEDNEYNGKVKSQIGDIFSAKDFDGGSEDAEDVDDDEVEEDDEEPEEKPVPKKKTAAKAKPVAKKTTKKKPDPEPEDDDDDEDEEVEDGDDEELEVDDL